MKTRTAAATILIGLLAAAAAGQFLASDPPVPVAIVSQPPLTAPAGGEMWTVTGSIGGTTSGPVVFLADDITRIMPVPATPQRPGPECIIYVGQYPALGVTVAGDLATWTARWRAAVGASDRTF